MSQGYVLNLKQCSECHGAGRAKYGLCKHCNTLGKVAAITKEGSDKELHRLSVGELFGLINKRMYRGVEDIIDDIGFDRRPFTTSTNYKPIACEKCGEYEAVAIGGSGVSVDPVEWGCNACGHVFRSNQYFPKED